MKNKKALFFREHVVIPALKYMDMKVSEKVIEILLGTAAQESHFIFRKQIKGPALGIWQMEPATFRHLIRNAVPRMPDARCKLLALCEPEALVPETLRVNDKLSCVMARILYLQIPEPLPLSGDLDGQARYWKKYYNTEKGSGTVAKYKRSWKKYVLNDSN